MMIFDSQKKYAGNWNVVDSRDFNSEEINAVKNAVVVSSEYGSSVCFYMKSGGQCYIPLSTSSTLGVGEAVDLNKAKLLTLHRDGSADITRVEI